MGDSEKEILNNTSIDDVTVEELTMKTLFAQGEHIFVVGEYIFANAEYVFGSGE